jgi:hypothetical protein
MNIKLTQSEYKNYVSTSTNNNEIDWEKMIDLLCKEGEWTTQGAETLVYLAVNYGSFILKNALALAEAANIEDGKVGL